ncbi:MAG: RecX family transcriptional regulator [Anaerolineales bacterium]|nr:RecX family transcriptional regulator [Anaerolineales bacterium]
MSRVVRSIEPDRRKPDRVHVRLEGGGELELDSALTARMQAGQSLDDEAVERLQAEDGVERAVRWAHRQIARRPRSEAEIRQGLRKRQVTAAQQDQVVGRLRTQGWLDDRAFADAWVENRRVFRPRSAFALRAELRQKGVAPDEIEAALAGHDDEAAAADAGRKAARRWSSAGPEEFQHRLTSHLMRRGFDYRTSASTARQLWKEMADGGEETDTEC